MELVTGVTFDEALRKLGERSPVGSILRSYEWSRVPTALRERAFFSATIEDVRWLQARKDFLQDTLAQTTAVNENGERYFVAGGRAKFIEAGQRDAIASGLRSTTDPNEIGGLKDIRSATRLGLIYDINLKAAQDYGYWKQGQDPDVLDAFPAQRFIRVQAVRKPRPLHQANRNEVRRKDDLKFWLAMNDPSIGGFGVPWGPWGFNSGMDVEDVGRAESDALGLTTAGETIKPVIKDFNDQLRASLENLDPRLVNLLKIAFGNRVTFEGATVKWAAFPEGLPPAPVPAPNEPPAPSDINFAAAGTPVSAAAEIGKMTARETARFNAALDVIDEVHGDGTLSPIPFKNTTAKRFLGAYLSHSDSAVSIMIRRGLPDTEFALTHEVGHWLDHIGMPSTSKFASEGAPELSDWLRAVQGTTAYRSLLSDTTMSRHFRNYLLGPRELWARSYAQFIAEESGDIAMQTSLDRVRSGNFGNMPAYGQWETNDFAPVRAAIRDLFVRLGWMLPPGS